MKVEKILTQVFSVQPTVHENNVQMPLQNVLGKNYEL
jgi:hypothetical protein